MGIDWGQAGGKNPLGGLYDSTPECGSYYTPKTDPTMLKIADTWKFLMLAGVLASPVLTTSCHKEDEKHHAAKKEHEDDDHEEHEKHSGGEHEEGHGHSKITVTRPLKKDTVVTREYVCQIRSRSNIEVRALERGYLEKIFVAEGQRVKEGDPMFKVLPLVYQAELKKAEAEAQVAKVKYDNTKRLFESNVVSDQELAITKAELEKAQAEVNLAQTHLGFTDIKAPFSGLMDRLHLRQGSLVDEGDLLTTLSDNSEVWVYFNVPEAEYLDYASHEQPEERKIVNLVMANGKVFKEKGRVNVIEAEFDNTTGTIPFRADFPNPDGLLRHGETGNIQMHKLVRDAIIIPQKATFEILDHHYVFVVGENDVMTQQRVHIAEEVEDLFIISKGVTEKDKIVLEGFLQVKNGDKAAYEFEEPEEAFKNLKHRAE